MKLLFLGFSLLFIACASTPRDIASVDADKDKKDKKRAPTAVKTWSSMTEK